MKFLEEHNKDIKKAAGISTSAPGPRFWISTGNFVMNKVISGRYRGGIGQGKLAMVAGPSSAGKSFIAGNLAFAAQNCDYGVLVVDSENALDDPFMQALGVDTENENYVYRGVSSIAHAITVISSFVQSYRKHGEETPFLIILDSLDALLTSSAEAAFEGGIGKGDQGQQAKQLKAMMAPLVHEIKDLNIAIVCTKQVYQTQDPIEAKNPATAWKLTEALKYPFSQILLVTRLFLKNDDKEYTGIRLKVFGLKTRFTKPFQLAKIEVPYDTGMDEYDGLLDVAVHMGLIVQNKAWYDYNGKKFQAKNFHTIQEEILAELIKREDEVINLTFDEVEVDLPEDSPEAAAARIAKVLESKKSKE